MLGVGGVVYDKVRNISPHQVGTAWCIYTGLSVHYYVYPGVFIQDVMYIIMYVLVYLYRM